MKYGLCQGCFIYLASDRWDISYRVVNLEKLKKLSLEEARFLISKNNILYNGAWKGVKIIPILQKDN